MKEVFKEYYSPDYEELWDNCTFIFDTLKETGRTFIVLF